MYLRMQRLGAREVGLVARGAGRAILLGTLLSLTAGLAAYGAPLYVLRGANVRITLGAGATSTLTATGLMLLLVFHLGNGLLHAVSGIWNELFGLLEVRTHGALGATGGTTVLLVPMLFVVAVQLMDIGRTARVAPWGAPAAGPEAPGCHAPAPLPTSLYASTCRPPPPRGRNGPGRSRPGSTRGAQTDWAVAGGRRLPRVPQVTESNLRRAAVGLDLIMESGTRSERAPGTRGPADFGRHWLVVGPTGADR